MARTLPKGRNFAIPDEVAAALATLQDAIAKQIDTVPDGWRTSEQWSEAWKISRRRTGELIRAGIASGNVEVRQFVVVNGPFRRPLRHYFVKVK